MKSRINFYLFLTVLIVLDAVLIRSPNLIGKLGLWFYKYHYLRTFPKALLTVTLVVGISALIAETIRFVVRKELIKRLAGQVILFLLTVLAIAFMAKVIMDFSSGSYSHTGIRFKSGAYLLPGIIIVVFVYCLITLPRPAAPVPEIEVLNSTQETNDN
jgi:hypothetical protein